MMKVQRIIAGAACILALGFGADAKDELTISATGGGRTLPISEVSSITFDGDRMTVSTAGGNFDFALADVEDITFDVELQGIDDMTQDLEQMQVAIEGGILTATAPADEPVNVAVYTISGAAVAHVAAKGSASVDLNPLASGVYIIRANNKTIKITR